MSARPPNILLLIADQLAQRAVGAYGASPSPTPHLDALAKRGVRFADAYTPCPICMPARAAFWTGRYPHQTGVLNNGTDRCIPPDMPTLGSLLAPRGYRALHIGKTHDCGGLRGIEVAGGRWEPVEEQPHWRTYSDTMEDRGSTIQAVEFLDRHGRDPFLLAVDYNNPHDICLWIGDHAGPHADTPVPSALPPLPPNFATGDEAARPIAIRRNCCGNPRTAQVQQWTPENFRHYLAAYRHYVERLDAEIATVLRALARRPDAADTLILFFADHGDGLASHRLVTKGGSLYEEVVRVPWIVAGPGVTGPREVRDEPVGLLDLLPTLCEVAGVAAPEELPGRSLLPWLRGSEEPTGHGYVLSAWHGKAGFWAPARLIRTRRHTYIHYREDNAEELFDIAVDPGQTRNLAVEPAAASALDAHRRLLWEHVERTADPYFEEPVEVPTDRRRHADRACPFVSFD